MDSEILSIFTYPNEKLEIVIDFIEKLNESWFQFQSEYVENHHLLYPIFFSWKPKLEDTWIDPDSLYSFDSQKKAWTQGWQAAREKMMNNSYWCNETDQYIVLQNLFFRLRFHASGLVECFSYGWGLFFDSLKYRPLIRRFHKELVTFFGAKQTLYCCTNLSTNCQIDDYRWNLERENFEKGLPLIGIVTFENLIAHLTAKGDLPLLDLQESLPIDWEDQREYHKKYNGYFLDDFSDM